MGNAVKSLLAFGPFRIDTEERLLLCKQQSIPLSPKAFELLMVLVQHSGQVVLKDDLMKTLWPDTFVEESNLGQHIFQLRKALGESAQNPSYIVTVPGRGYRFLPTVQAVPAETDEEIVLESHSRSRVVIEEEEGFPDRATASAPKLRRMVLAISIAVVGVLTGAAVIMLWTPSAPRVVSVRQITHSGRVQPYSRVLSDGSRLYFVQQAGGKGSLVEAPIAGGEASPISTSVSSLLVYDIDPGKSRLLIGTQGANFNQPLFVVPTTGGSGRRVGNLMASESATWAPDGQTIIYGHDAQIYRVGDSGGQPVLLLSASGYVTSLRLSPDGKLLRFTVRDVSSGGTHLWESAADGANPHLLSLGWKTASTQWGEGECCGDWTPDGRYFVFRSVHDGVESLWAIREKGGWFNKNASAPVLLYTSPDHVGAPRFSTDGRKLFFVNYQERRELVRYDSAQKLFVPYLGGVPARLLSFSPDGKWVAYRNETDNSLWRSRVDGTEKQQLTFPPMVAYHSTWSPDGKKIVFGGRLPGERGRLYLVPSDGGSPELLTNSQASDGEPSWSADGRFIAFERWIANAAGSLHSAIFLLDMNTRETRMVPGTQDFDGVHWSPDGKYLAASDQANRKLMLFDFNRQQWSELSDGPPYGWGIRWSADSRYVYYQHSEGEEQPIFRVRISDRKIEQITSARQILRADVLGYTMTGLTPDGSPLASLSRRNSDIYVLELELP